MVIDFIGGNGGGGGTAQYATSAGTANNAKLLDGAQAFPQSANTGDVVAMNGIPTRGLRDATPEAGVYQYDGTNWNKIEGGSAAYKIELSTNEPDDFTEGDIDNLNDFFDAVKADPSIAKDAYIDYDGEFYRCSYDNSDEQSGDGTFTFVLVYSDWIDELQFTFLQDGFDRANHIEWNGNYLIPSGDFPADPEEGMIANYSDGEGNFGLYRYDGGDWVPFGGDNTVLKAVNDSPAGADEGDVYAYHEDAEDYIVGDDWTDTGSDTAEWNSDPDSGNPQAIAIQIGKNGSLDLGYSCGDWTDSISFYVNDYEFSADDGHGNWEEVDGRYILSNSDWLEKTNGAKLYAIFDDSTVELYIFTDDVTEVWPYRVENTSAEGNIFTGTITPPHGPINKLYQMVYDEDEDALVPTEIAHKSDLNEYFKKEEGTEDQDLWAYNGWNNTWGVQHRNAIIQNGLQETFPYDENDGLVYLGRTEHYEIGLKKIDQTILKAKNSLPIQSEDGAVYALPSSGYGIVQAQSAHTGQDWFNYAGKTVPTGWTQMRVPYNDTAESQLLHFKTDANGEGQMDLYWHPEDPSDRRWDGLPDGTSQNDGEFSTTDNWGNTIVATKVGNYIVVTFGAGVINGEEDIYVKGNVEVYTTDDITDYVNAVMSKDIARMVKCTQAEYDALVSGGTVDNSTFYVIISPNV